MAAVRDIFQGNTVIILKNNNWLDISLLRYIKIILMTKYIDSCVSPIKLDEEKPQP